MPGSERTTGRRATSRQGKGAHHMVVFDDDGDTAPVQDHLAVETAGGQLR